MANRRFFRIVAAATAMVLVTAAGCKKPTEWMDASAHKNAFVTANGIRINYLDWGGTGPALILIHGFGDNPHAFDDLAPAFTDRFHVIAYARRGHGDSESKAPYDTATLTEDLRALMDALGIAKANLAGWSMGGNEITAMAGTHPERVDHIVYLEGAYDWGDPAFAAAFKSWPIDFSAMARAMSSLDTYRAFQMQLFPAVSDASRLEAYIRDQVVIQPDGTLRQRMSDSVTERSFPTRCLLIGGTIPRFTRRPSRSMLLLSSIQAKESQHR